MSKRRGRPRKNKGGSWFTDIFTKHIPSAAKAVHGFVKDNKIASTALAFVPHPAAKVAAAAARLAGYGKKINNIQSILFPADKWNVTQAKKWLKEHGYKTSFHQKGVHRTKNYLRFRQSPPNPGRYRIKRLGGGIELVLRY